MNDADVCTMVWELAAPQEDYTEAAIAPEAFQAQRCGRTGGYCHDDLLRSMTDKGQNLNNSDT